MQDIDQQYRGHESKSTGRIRKQYKQASAKRQKYKANPDKAHHHQETAHQQSLLKGNCCLMKQMIASDNGTDNQHIEETSESIHHCMKVPAIQRPLWEDAGYNSDAQGNHSRQMLQNRSNLKTRRSIASPP
jgi:hypothetical protein